MRAAQRARGARDAKKLAISAAFGKMGRSKRMNHRLVEALGAGSISEQSGRASVLMLCLAR